MAKLDVKFIRESLTGRWDIDVIVGGQKVSHLIYFGVKGTKELHAKRIK
jgi:hypothetical protein